MPAETIYWYLPTGFCEDVLELANVGFASAPCNAKQDLSKGWLHNTLYLDNIFSVYNVFIGGDGVYLDTTTGTEKTNAICLDDNLYFYVNGELKYRGGTVGAVVGNINTYEAGDEVMKCTGGCTGVPQRWCIPAFELSANGFNFGQDNSIDILVEDFCGDETPSGGMSELRLILI